MSRKRANWTPAGETLFDALAAQGLPAGEIAQRLQAAGERGASRATVGRRLAERAGPRRSGRAGNADATPAAPPSEPAPSSTPSPTDVLADPEPDESTTTEEIATWLERVDRAYSAAKATNNAPAIAALAARATALIEARRKAAPPPPPDPNERPDLVEAAGRARALLRKKLEAALARRAR